ncbi:MAG: dTDP-4-dehydrorhamnose 3,5-epimerase family protein [Acidimicrobiia bacterium]
MNAEPTAIAGCAVLPLFHHADDRGEFVKVFQASAAVAFESTAIAELFWSRSGRGVVRGLHFQVPPHAHHKLVTIITGSALDVVVDVRVGSRTYGTTVTIPLDAGTPTAVTVPMGCAHGFQATAEDTVIVYATSTEHAPNADRGIRWDSIGVDWPIAEIVVSDRDAAFPSLGEFDSPFTDRELA